MSEYNPFDGSIGIVESEKLWFTRRIDSLETEIAKLKRNAKNDAAAIDRCRDLIELLCVELEVAAQGRQIELTSTARCYLNVLYYGRPDLPRLNTVKEQSEKLKEMMLGPIREQSKARAYAVNKQAEIKEKEAKAAAKKAASKKPAIKKPAAKKPTGKKK